MSNINVQQRKFIVKAGMTVDDVKNSKEATAMQKKYASAFDTDGQKGFSQKEADLFNSTTFSEKADGTVTFWTRQKDGTKKGTKFNSNDNNIQFKSDNEVKPYVKKVSVKKAAPKQNESVSFFDEAWSGHQIARLTGDNAVTDWLQDKDKVCTDGKDDGKIGLWEGTKSLVKGLVGGIPKAMINHPVATAVMGAVGAGAIALTGGAILPVLGAVGVATGAGMVGYGGYKAATAKTDGEAKQALETMGMGVTTTALSVAAADHALEKAAEAGVKSAQVSKDANIFQKTVQMFKSIPESLKLGYKNTKFNLGFHVEGAYKKYSRGYAGIENKILVEEKTPGGVYREYTRGDQTLLKDESILIKEELANGTTRKYEAIDGSFSNYNLLTEERYANGSYRKYGHKHFATFKKDYRTLSEEGFANGEIKKYNILHQLEEHRLPDGTIKNYINSKCKVHTNLYTEYKPDGSKLIKTKDGTVIESFDKDGNLVESLISKKLNSDGTISQSAIDELKQIGIDVRTVGDSDDFVVVNYSLKDANSSSYIEGKLRWVRNNEYTATHYDKNTGMKTNITYSRSQKVEPHMID